MMARGPASTMEFFGAACCFLAIVSLATCEQRPSVSYISPLAVKEIGEEVEFNCTIQNQGGLPMQWFKLGKNRSDPITLSVNATTILSENGRISVSVDEQTLTYNLRIRNLTNDDTGFYQCQIPISLHDKVIADTELQIRRPSTIRATTGSVNVTVGKSVDLHCEADGFPVPSITWRREDDAILPFGGLSHKGNVLQITNAHRNDRGVYYCIADNAVGAPARGNVTVNVEFAPLVTAVRPRVGQAQGYDVALECKIEAYPRPVQLVWLRDGAELRREESRAAAAEFVDTLTRYSVGLADYGEYVCRAENALGAAEAKVELFESVLPACGNSCG